MNVKDLGSRLMRWRIQLAEYDYEILYKRGSLNTNVDGLSRIGNVGTTEEQTDIPDAKTSQILYEFHDSPVGGHRGMNKTYRAIRSQYTWPKMKDKSKEHYDKTAKQTKLQVGEKVLLFYETVRQGRSRKLNAQWIGPYIITEMDKVNATITRRRKSTRVHVNRLTFSVRDFKCQ
jgi:hypothetical protein